MTELGGYGAMLVTAFLAATLLPAQSELLLAGLALSGAYDPLLLLISASIGNTAGSVVNWAIGRGAGTLLQHPRLRTAAAMLQRAEALFNRYGRATLLFAWLPLIGDPLTVVAGMLRVGFWPFVILVSIGKTARYALVLYGSVSVAED